MFKNYIKTIYRNIKREKLFTLLNLSGLGLGLGCVLVIFKIITYETSFDKHHSNYDNIYRIVRQSSLTSGINYNEGVPHPIAGGLRVDYPELLAVMTHYEPNHQIAVKRENGDFNRFQDEVGLVFTESVLFSIFDFKFIEGNPKTCLDDPRDVVLSRSRAKQYFGLKDGNLADAIGMEILLENKIRYKVSALIEDYKETTDIPFNVLLNYQSVSEFNRYYQDGQNWGSNSSSTNCYILTPKGYDIDYLDESLIGFVDKYHGENTSQRLKLNVQPLSEVHFDTRYDNYSERTISKESIVALGIIGIFLIITAAINFVNLTTAQSIKRAKEIGIRKTLGGKTSQLANQFLVETMVITVISSLVGLLFAEVLLIYLEDIIGYKLWINLFEEPQTLAFLVSNIVIIGLLAGLYPAISLSRLDPVTALKAKFNTKQGSGFLSFRRVLVITQFIITQVLILGTIVVSEQMDFFLNKDLGFEKDNIILSYLPDNDPVKLETFKNTLLASSDIIDVSCSYSSPMGTSNANTHIGHRNIAEGEQLRVNFKIGDKDYFELYGLRLIAGEMVVKSDTAHILVNRKLAEALGFNDPQEVIGEKISGWYQNMQIVGVFENFHTHSLKDDFAHAVFMNNPDFFLQLAVKINTKGKNLEEIDETLSFIQQEWENNFTNDIYDFDFYDEQLASWYDQEKNMGSMFKIFSVIAIFIGCLGLYGLISYVANKKTKEIGVRKVLGATTTNILGIFSREMLVLVLIAFAIAAPLGYYVMNSWLEDFVYKIDLSVSIFAFSLSISFGIAIVTAGYKAAMASLANPVLSLRNE